LTWDNIGWAFRSGYAGNWHPLTWISLMLDVQLFGPGAAGLHAMNLLFHVANTVLLFITLQKFTRAFWRSAFVAALFALHPLHMESVAWISERKDVLSAFFALLMLNAYGGHVKNSVAFWTSRNYWLALLFFALGLMSKPMLVTIPFLLLLLDYWPLRRWEINPVGDFYPGFARLALEKVPFLLLSAVSCVVTFIVQRNYGAVQTLTSFSISERIANAFISYARYLGKTIWPENLAVYYPHPGHWPFVLVTLAGILISGLCVGVLWVGRRIPFAVTGWFWFLGMMIPVIGLVQVGDQSMADRYTYLPLTGLFIVFVWGAGALLMRWRISKAVIGIMMVAVMAVLAARTTSQLHHWRDSESLLRHAIAVTGPNYLAQNNLGDDLLRKGKIVEAIPHFQTALAIQPNFAQACNNLGKASLQNGQLDVAILYFQKAFEIDSGYAEAHNNLAIVLAQKGQLDGAIAQFEKALAINPALIDTHRNLGVLLAQNGRIDEAIIHFQKILEVQPGDAETHNNLASALLQKGRLDEATLHYQKALAINPDSMAIQNNLARIAWVLATSPDSSVRNGVKAVELAQQIDRLSGGKNPLVIGALAAAYAGTGRFPEAVSAAQLALQLAASQKNTGLMTTLQAQLKSYSAGATFHEINSNAPDAPQPP
jgi:tetratricopeptide (TPR) repeat protein